MTLILSCASHNWLVQVSDRRLTANKRLVDDEANKALLFHNCLAIGYTGLAEIHRMRTDMWLLNTLMNSQSLMELLQRIQVKASEAFSTINLSPEIKRTAFVGIGWFIPESDPQLYPGIFRISNACDEYGGFLPQARNTFDGKIILLKKTKQFSLEVTGQPISKSKLKSLKRNIKRIIEHGTGPRAVIRLFVDAIREEARENPTVGSNLMAISLPRIKEESCNVQILQMGAPQMDVPTFLYIPADRYRGISYGPNWIGPGASFGQVTFRSLDNNS